MKNGMSDYIRMNDLGDYEVAESDAQGEGWMLDDHRSRGYTGPNQRLGDYFIRELSREGTDRRQTVQFEVVGTGRIESMARSRFEKMVRPA